LIKKTDNNLIAVIIFFGHVLYEILAEFKINTLLNSECRDVNVKVLVGILENISFLLIDKCDINYKKRIL
jgi:hypothetical protein